MSSGSGKPSKGRVLQPEEMQLWRKVTETVVPVEARPASDDEMFAAMMRQHDVPQTPRPVQKASSQSYSIPVVQPAGRSKAPELGAFDSRQSRQISRGHIEIDAVLDLHGMRQDEAHGALKRFLVQSQARGSRYVTVITGKGRRVDEDDLWGERERGVLRRVVRTWLEDADFRSLVVSYTTAPRNHGGEGALFVHVRRANRPRKR